MTAAAKITTGAASTAVTSVKGGAGDDTITIGVDLTKAIAVDGGAGNDILAVTNATFAADAFASVTNVETIALASSGAAVSIDLKSVAGVTAVNSALQTTAANKSGTLAVSNLASGAAVTLSSKNLSDATPTAPATFD